MNNHPNRRRPRQAASSSVAFRQTADASTVDPKQRKHRKPLTRSRADHDRDYNALCEAIAKAFDSRVSHGKLFTTDAAGLYDLYLNDVGAERQMHTCHCCRRFIETYGGLVVITDIGVQCAAMWFDNWVPEFYRPAVQRMRKRVERAKVTGVFLSSDSTWGTPITGEWTHFAVPVPQDIRYMGREIDAGRPIALNAGQAMAATLENFKTVTAALGQFQRMHIEQAIRLLEADALTRSEKFIGPVNWLHDLQKRVHGQQGYNYLWKRVASAPEGYCHPRASVVGSLLEDIAEGRPFADISKRFAAKLDPTKYQRAQVAPTAGNIEAAERLVEKLGLARSLPRRFAKLHEVMPHARWMPFDTPLPFEGASAGGVFSHLTPKGEHVQTVQLPAVTVTWTKFEREVLITAEKMEIHVPSHGNFIGMTTAMHADAPPILKWDDVYERNPVAWYCYAKGSSAQQWGLRPGWAKVLCVVPLPNLWGERPTPYLFDGRVLVIDDAHDKQHTGGALFPELLRDELHGIRSTVEAYSRSATLAGKEDGVCGFDVRSNAAACVLRVFKAGGWSTFTIDRWD